MFYDVSKSKDTKRRDHDAVHTHLGQDGQEDFRLVRDQDQEESEDHQDYFEEFLMFLLQSGLSDDEIVECCEMLEVDGDLFEKDQVYFIENILGFHGPEQENDPHNLQEFPSVGYIMTKSMQFNHKRND